MFKVIKKSTSYPPPSLVLDLSDSPGSNIWICQFNLLYAAYNCRTIEDSINIKYTKQIIIPVILENGDKVRFNLSNDCSQIIL